MDNKESLGSYAFSHREFEVLTHIMKVLDVAHRAQELLSAEQTPTLALAFPVYEKMLRDWRDLAKQYGALSYAIKAAMDKIEAYMEKSRTSPIHILAMFLNPCIKYTFIDRSLSWSEEAKENAREVIKDFVLSATPARQLGTTFEPGPMISPARAAANRRENAVALEHDSYLAAPLRPLEELGKIDLVNHWSMQTTLPILQAMSRDVLPVQASSVSSERVFSSSKNTCTLARNKLGADTVEMLQILKYSLRQHHRIAKAQFQTPATHDSDGGHPITPDGSDEPKTLDLMARLGDDWGDDAILDADNDRVS
ncbi:unnamed protein product [Rhizoctonia solani]|uniref:HAT C-terminal dimerisation domain-containing protein n=1 Tax=Rhizoctonia solani TaxID=456999 RepID=A0A8H2XTD6_9AGAM|nr:unnamed protein product [Rhizoctonia solani]